MRQGRSCAMAIAIALNLPGVLFAAAPVIDESEHYAIQDQTLALNEQPLARDTGSPDMDYADEQPLARDTTSSRSTHNNASVLNQVQQLQQEIQELRGQIEVQNHEIKVLREQQLSFYKDLDARVPHTGTSTPKAITKPTVNSGVVTPTPSATMSKTGSTTVIPATVTPPPHANPADEQVRYLAAFDLIKTKRFDEALTAMNAFVTDYPTGGYSANAYYWLGELYMTQKNYPKAISNFETVLQRFPSSSKSAPSLLKMGYALAASGQNQEARARLKQVIQQYPDTHSAHLAEAKIKSLGR